MSVQMRDRDLIHQEGLKGGWRDRGPGGRGATHAGGAGASAELEAGGALDGVEQLAAQQGLVPELGQLQQVHAGAGRGQPLQVGAPVVDAEGRVQLLRDRGAGRGVSGRPGGHTRTTGKRRQARVRGAAAAAPALLCSGNTAWGARPAGRRRSPGASRPICRGAQHTARVAGQAERTRAAHTGPRGVQVLQPCTRTSHGLNATGPSSDQSAHATLCVS